MFIRNDGQLEKFLNPVNIIHINIKFLMGKEHCNIFLYLYLSNKRRIRIFHSQKQQFLQETLNKLINKKTKIAVITYLYIYVIKTDM